VSAAQPDPYADRDRGHAAAVRRSLGWADEAAERADWADALGWIEVVEACGDELPDEFRAKRDRWLLALSEQPSRGQRADPAA
jgi:hypothetical protein